jgi:predicted nucleic acid-binding protein
VYAVVDSSTLISLAWAGQLQLLVDAPLDLVVPAEVVQETVEEGLDHGYADAAAIGTAVKALATADPAGTRTVDEAVLKVGRRYGLLITNDLALGRRAANFSVRWLRTADLVVLCVRTGRITADRGGAAVRALRSAGRLTDELARTYLEELR